MTYYQYKKKHFDGFAQSLWSHKGRKHPLRTNADILIITKNCKLHSVPEKSTLPGPPVINFRNDLCLIAVPGNLNHPMVLLNKKERGDALWYLQECMSLHSTVSRYKFENVPFSGWESSF